jgi:hypothetical protein
MPNKIQLFAVSDTKELVQNETNAGPASLPTFVQNDVVPLELTLLNKTGSITSPFTRQTDQQSVRVGIVTPHAQSPTVHAVGTLSFFAGAGTYNGSISLSTQEIATLLGASTAAAATFEIEVVGGQSSVYTIQKPVEIRADGLKLGAPVAITGTQSFLDSGQSDDRYLRRTGVGTAQGDWSITVLHGGAGSEAKFTRDTDSKVFSLGSWAGASWSTGNPNELTTRGDVVVLVGGGTLSSGEIHRAADPSHDNALARKSYVDARVLAGGTLTNDLHLPGIDEHPKAAASIGYVLAHASTPQVDSTLNFTGSLLGVNIATTGSLVSYTHLHTTSQVAEESGPLYFTATRVRETALTGIDTSTQAVIVAGDNVLSGLGKLEAAKVSKSNGTFTSPVRFSPGTAGAPAITIASDLDTGIFWPTAGNTISIATDGGELVRFGGGAVTIGATTAISTLGIVGHANWSHLIVRGNATQTVDLVQIQDSAETVLTSINKDGALVISNSGLFGSPKGVKITSTNSAGYAAVELTNNSGGSGFLKMLGSGGSPIHALVLENAGAADVCIRTDGIDRVRVTESGEVQVTGLRVMASGGASLEGAVWQNDAQNALATYVGGLASTLPGVIYTSTADKNVASTTAETSIIPTGTGTLTLPANFWVVGKTIKITLIGFLRSKSSAPGTLDVRTKLGAVNIGATGGFVMDTGLSDIITRVNVLMTCRTTGATGTVKVCGALEYLGSGVTYFKVQPFSQGSMVVDTTASSALDMTATFSVSDATNSWTTVDVAFEVLN